MTEHDRPPGDSHLSGRDAGTRNVLRVLVRTRNLRDGSRCNVVIVSVPPDILDYPTSTDMVVREGSNVTLRCAATGTPEPTVTWRREAGGTISLSNWHEGTYLCASAITIALSDANWVCYSVIGLLPQIEGFPLARFCTPFQPYFIVISRRVH